jgi:hypothetical protein
MSNVITFPGRSATMSEAARPLAFAASTACAKRNRRSPYRKLWYTAEMAFVELNKVDRQHTERELEKIREGVEAAQTLAKEMARAAEGILPKQRGTNSEAMTRRREFKLAMRQRIKDIAASRDLSEEDIRPALTLKHHAIARFSERHGVNLEWLFEGRGHIFEKDPSAAELAAVVRTLPEAEQQMIEAAVDRLLKERGL